MGLDPYDYDFHEDPYPYYKRLRDEAPLYYNEQRGFWAVSRHADVHQGFRNSTTLSNRDGVSLDPTSRGPHASKTMSFLAMDDPDHLRLRTLVSKGFTPRRIRELEPRVTEIAVHHLDTMLEKAEAGTVDYVDEFAGKLPMDVISELMGVPEPDRDQVRAWADAVMHREDGVTDVPPAAIEASINLIVYYQDMIAERRKKATDDLTSRAAGSRDRRRPAQRRGNPRIHVPDGDRRQRDHHQTPCQCGVLGPQESGSD